MNDIHNDIIGKVGVYVGDAHPHVRGRTGQVLWTITERGGR